MAFSGRFLIALLTGFPLVWLCWSNVGLAQSIQAAPDDTHTVVTRDGDRYQITGGRLSSDQENLFQSFNRLGLRANEIATFLATPNLRNILGRVTGGDPSVINGLLQVTGGSANLYLLNPAGILFGPNARLDLPASFTATTATGIGFGNGWLSAVGTSDYAALVGTPNAYAFSVDQPGAIVNAGNLGVAPAQTLTLLGGTVVNTGSLSAPGGQITIAAIPGQNLVRVSQSGMLLSLEIQPIAARDQGLGLPNLLPFTPASLPELLTGGNLDAATGITVTPDGSVQLIGSQVAIPTESGTVVGSGTIDASAIAPTQTGGNIRISGQQIGLVEANIQAIGTGNGGTVVIGGDRPSPVLLQRPNPTLTTQHIYISPDSTIRADAQGDGNGGQVSIMSAATTRIQGTISARGGDRSGQGGFVETSSDQFLEITTAPDVSAAAGLGGIWLIDPHNVTIGAGAPVIPAPPFTAGVDNSFLPTATLRAALTGGATVIVSTGTTGTQAGDIRLAEGLDFNGIGSGTLRLEAANNLNIGSEVFDSQPATADTLNLFLLADSDNSGEGRLTINPFGRLNTGGGDIVGIGSSNGFAGIELAGPIQSDARNITLTGTSTTQGILFNNSNLNLTGGGTLTLNGAGTGEDIRFDNTNVLNLGASNAILTANQIGLGTATTIQGSGSLPIQLQTAGATGTTALTGTVTFGNSVALRSPNQSINTAGATLIGAGNAAITLQAGQNLTTGPIRTTGQPIALRSDNGAIDTGTLQTSVSTGNAGAVTLVAPNGTIRTGAIDTSSATGQGGAIAFNSTGQITTGNLTFGSLAGSASGSLDLITSDTVDLSAAIVTDHGASVSVGNAVTQPNNIFLPVNLLRTNGGSFTIVRDGNLTLNGSVDTGGGRFSLRNTNGDLTLNGAVNTAGGNFDLTSSGALTLSNPISTGGGNINLTGTAIATRDLNTSADASGGNLSLTATATDITTGNLNSSGISGGSILLNAANNITAGEINTSGISGNGGPVSLDSNQNLSVTSINAQGGTAGIGGSVDITAGRFFRAIGDFIDRNNLSTSISTAGGLRGNAITISHGGNGTTPFVVGDATTNGTTAAISSGNSTISPLRSFLRSFSEGDINIITNAPPLPPTPTPVPPTPTPPTPPPTPTPPTPPTPPSPTPSPPPITLPFELPPRLCPPDCPATLPPNALAESNAITLEQAQNQLQNIEQQTGVTPALLYVNFVPNQLPLEADFERREATSTQAIATYAGRPTALNSLALPVEPKDSDELELLLITPHGEPVRRQLKGVTRAQVLPIVRRLFQEVTDRTNLRTTTYLPPAQQLYQWIIAPVAADLQAQQIQNIGFVMDEGLRSLPVAVLHDGHQFLIEHYSVGLLPSLNLVDTRYTSIRDRPVLAMGASEFQTLPNLPAVPTELGATQLDGGKSYLNQAFTVENLRSQQQQNPFSIIHLATHGEFGNPDRSYIQFWDQQLRLDQLRQLQLNNPPVELLVLSACRTALGNQQAELGFAGFALQAGVKTTLASLWYVNDDGTLGLMAEFYRQLRTAPIKAEALRQTQLAMIQGKVRFQNGQLQLSSGVLPLPLELQLTRNTVLSHPYYWSAFTLVGSPW